MVGMDGWERKHEAEEVYNEAIEMSMYLATSSS